MSDDDHLYDQPAAKEAVRIAARLRAERLARESRAVAPRSDAAQPNGAAAGNGARTDRAGVAPANGATVTSANGGHANSAGVAPASSATATSANGARTDRAGVAPANGATVTSANGGHANGAGVAPASGGNGTRANAASRPGVAAGAAAVLDPPATDGSVGATEQSRSRFPEPPRPRFPPPPSRSTKLASPAPPLPPPRPVEPGRPRTRTKLRKLRLLALVLAGMALGLVSFVFGMFMAVASDLGQLEKDAGFVNAHNSVLVDDRGVPLAELTEQNRVFVTYPQIPQIVDEAVISVEDKRFYTNDGIDLRSVARALLSDVFHTSSGLQGASTIEEQFVKNSLAGARSHRTVFEKLREAALAYHLAHEWPKSKILTAYLNTIYFGNGAYGIEAAARTYFAWAHPGCGTIQQLCVSELEPWEAALLAGIIASPTAFDPVTHPNAAKARRDLVLQQMLSQGYITQTEYDASVNQQLPDADDVRAPTEIYDGPADTGYFDSWATQLAINRFGSKEVFQGGLKIRTTLDLGLQKAAIQAIDDWLPNPDGPDVSLVAIDNATGEVRAMVGGRDYATTPFNLATQGERQPGSSWKAFDLAAALTHGVSPSSIWNSHIVSFHVSTQPLPFVVHNDEDSYLGPITLAQATAYSDNTVFAQLGLHIGTRVIAHYARHMGITTLISENAAMVIGGLTIGVTPLDMAHAYETLAEDGNRVDGSLVPSREAVGIESVSVPRQGNVPAHVDANHVRLVRELHPYVAQTETSMLEGVIDDKGGTGGNAQIGTFAAGKTGTTSNYVDAWFVGWDSKYTVAVWVGYPQGDKSMATDYNGGPVLGGTYPALIWRDFMLAALQLDAQRNHTPLNLTPTGPGDSAPGTDTSVGTVTPAATVTTTPTPSTATATGDAAGTAGAATAPAGGTATGTGTATATAPTTTGTPAATGTQAPATTQTPAATQTPASAPSTPATSTTPPPASSSTGGASAPTGGSAAPTG